MRSCVIQLFYRLFYYLEEIGWLNPVNDIHLYALHYIYLPRLNKALEEFKYGWNHHGIRTESGHTPEQLFVSGTLRLRHSGMTAVDFFETVDEAYGVEDGLAAEDDIILPQLSFHFADEHLQQLRDSINPTANSNNYGIELYQQTLAFINTKINENPEIYETTSV